MKLDTIHMGYGGVFTLNSPILIMGQGSPRLAITCSVHGDEHTGIFIVKEMLERLDEEDIIGSVSFVLAANPSAQFVGQRVSPQDMKDLNRVGEGRESGTYTERVAHNLFGFLKNFDFVVNIHEFKMHTPITAVYMNAGDHVVREKTLAGIKAFGPDIVWVIEYSQSGDVQYSSTIDMALARSGIPNFPIETTHISLISESDIKSVSDRLIKLMEHLKIMRSAQNGNQGHSSPVSFDYYVRREITSDVAGIWEPWLQILQKVSRGDAIGNVYQLPTLERIVIKSPVDGMLLQVRHRQLVHTGTSLFSIGLEYRGRRMP